ncbi:MAG: COX15/CtaA family protein [Corynebacterium sp.]|nr:COX15/CtaA family protein [Corynebacterium sp.]
MALQQKLALLLLVSQGGITVSGSIVRVTGSGLGCNTWPNCHEGSLVPVEGAAPAIHQAIEFGNRLLTFVLIAFVIAVFLAVRAAHRRKEIIVHAVIQGLGIIAQAIIGGVSVLLQLAWWSVVLHFLPSMLLVWLAAILYFRIKEPDHLAPQRTYSTPLRILNIVFATGIALVLVTGTMVTGAGQHSGDINVGADNRLQISLALIAHIHAWTLYATLGILLVLVVGLWLTHTPRHIQKTGWILVGIILMQAAVGITQFRLGVPRWTVPIHVGLSSMIVAYSSFLYSHGSERISEVNPKTTTGSPTGDELYAGELYSLAT